MGQTYEGEVRVAKVGSLRQGRLANQGVGSVDLGSTGSAGKNADFMTT